MWIESAENFVKYSPSEHVKSFNVNYLIVFCSQVKTRELKENDSQKSATLVQRISKDSLNGDGMYARCLKCQEIAFYFPIDKKWI